MPRPEPLILAIDQGTSATKTVLVNRAGDVVARGTAAVGMHHPHRGWVEQSPTEIWHSLHTSARDCLKGADPRQVIGLGLSTQRESVLLWDRRTGQARSPLISWQDQRTAAICGQYAAAAAAIRRGSGLPLDPMFSATKARWLLDHFDPDRTRASRGDLCLGTVDAWLMYRLTGEHQIEVGNAARTQLMDIETCQWSAELLNLFGVPAPSLPRITGSAGPFAPRRGSEGLLPASVPVLSVMGDSHAALFGHAGWRDGLVKASYGTGSSVMATSSRRAGQSSGLCDTIAWQIGAEPVRAVEGNIRASGATLAWLAELTSAAPAVLASLAANATADGVHLVPGFNGLGAPWWDSATTGLLTGLTLGTRLENVARAALESIAFQVNDLLIAIRGIAGEVGVLCVDGGAAANSSLMQLQADLSGTSVLRPKSADLSALGAAHLAGLAAGLWSPEDLDALPRPREEFRPATSAGWRAEELAGWRAAVQRTRYHPQPDDPKEDP